MSPQKASLRGPQRRTYPRFRGPERRTYALRVYAVARLYRVHAWCLLTLVHVRRYIWWLCCMLAIYDRVLTESIYSHAWPKQRRREHAQFAHSLADLKVHMHCLRLYKTSFQNRISMPKRKNCICQALVFASSQNLKKFTLHTSHFSLLASHSKPHTSHFTLRSSHSKLKLHTPDFTILTSHCFLHTAHFTLHSSRPTLHTALNLRATKKH